MSCVLVMAGGTGGHVVPALAVAEKLRNDGIEVVWLGTSKGIESKLVPAAGFILESIWIGGLRSSGIKRKLMMPLMLVTAVFQAFVIILRHRPVGVLGMGGFVSGPGGALSILLHLPLVIHEQNAIAGMTNRWLGKWAQMVLTGFPQPHNLDQNTIWVGNPVHPSIAQIKPPEQRLAGRSDKFRILVAGGSQGAEIFNCELPGLLKQIDGSQQLEIWHQSGQGRSAGIGDRYIKAGVNSRVNEFIEDMARAYAWCDMVVCRAGAMTVAEVCAAGCVALFVPYPYAVNDHQSANAKYLSSNGAALIVSQSIFIQGDWLQQLIRLKNDRKRLIRMAVAARKLAKPQAAVQVAQICTQVMHA